MPELRLVVLALQDKLAYGPTFEDALASLYGTEASSVRGTESAPPATPAAASTAAPQTRAPQATDQNALIAEAGKDFADYEHLTAEGKLAEAGQKLDDLKRVLDKLNAHPK
jgi:uncharacterized membrane protein (UPF0182 family)